MERTNRPLLLLGISERGSRRLLVRVGLELDTYRIGDESALLSVFYCSCHGVETLQLNQPLIVCLLPRGVVSPSSAFDDALNGELASILDPLDCWVPPGGEDER